MMAIDMGGPFNKAICIRHGLTEGNAAPIAMVGGMIPPLAIARNDIL